MSAAQRVLDRVQRVKKIGPNKWSAACPCCQSKAGRPLAIRETDDSRCLLWAFCGCETSSVLAALGLSMTDLFDRPLAHHLPPVGGGFSARDLLELGAHEATVAALIISDALQEPMNDEQRSRLAEAATRLARVLEFANVGG